MVKFILFLFIWVMALIPTWVFLLIKYLLAPEGFWQNLVVFGGGIYFLGLLQFVLFCIGVFASLALIADRNI